MPWRPDKYEVDFVDEHAFDAALEGFSDTDADRLLTLLKRMEYPQHHDSRRKDYKKVRGKVAEEVGLHEVRAHFGPGYRVYFGYRANGNAVIIAGVGTKRTQSRDIEHASATLEQWDRKQARVQRGGPQNHPAGGRQ